MVSLESRCEMEYQYTYFLKRKKEVEKNEYGFVHFSSLRSTIFIFGKLKVQFCWIYNFFFMEMIPRDFNASIYTSSTFLCSKKRDIFSRIRWFKYWLMKSNKAIVFKNYF